MPGGELWALPLRPPASQLFALCPQHWPIPRPQPGQGPAQEHRPELPVLHPDLQLAEPLNADALETVDGFLRPGRTVGEYDGSRRRGRGWAALCDSMAA